jgi:hypothetical protein
MAKIITLGEIMLRLSPVGNDRFIQSETLRSMPHLRLRFLPLLVLWLRSWVLMAFVSTLFALVR